MQRIAIHKFSCSDDVNFNKEQYSEFKYGKMSVTVKFAQELAWRLGLYIMDTVKEGEEVFITGAPYNQVPVASTALAEYTAAFLQRLLLPHSSTRLGEWITIKTFKISRQHSYHDDYGNMSAELREKSITGETFHVEPALLEGKHVICIDDIYITGAHERRVEKMFDSLNILSKSLVFAYYAQLTGECDPGIESQLNHAKITPVGSAIWELLAHDIIVNTRLTKYLLSLSRGMFGYVLGAMSPRFRTDLWKAGLANNYAHHELYKTNFLLLDQTQ